MRMILWLMTLLTFVSCSTTMKDLKPTNVHQSFVLNSNYTMSGTGGLLNVKFVAGLARGTYNLIGEDSDYLYFVGTGDSVIVLESKFADEYTRSGTVAPWAERNSYQLTHAGGVGGIRLPKPSSSYKPQLFYETHMSPNSVAGGVLINEIGKIGEGAFQYFPFSPPDLYQKIKIVTK